jgi:ATP-dependent protease ClpP protease subunit
MPMKKTNMKPVNSKAPKNEDDAEEEEDPDLSGISRENNHVYFYSEIDRKSIFKLIGLIKEAEEYSIITSLRLHIDEVPIYLHIHSDGGYVFDAFVAIDVIRSCRVPVHSIIDGATASGGTLMSVVCAKRYIRPSAFMLIHQLSSECWGKMREIEDEYANLVELMDKIKLIYKENSKMKKKQIKKLLNHDLWLNSETSIEYGLADGLWLK